MNAILNTRIFGKAETRIIGLTCTLLFYRLLQVVASPLIFLYFLLRFVTDRAYRSDFGERLGLRSNTAIHAQPDGIWLHAVSAGEVASAAPLVEAIRQQAPHLSVYLSTSTTAGRRMAEQRFHGRVDVIFYAPVDYVFAVRRTLRALRPALVIILETEIWPNTYNESRAAGCGLMLINSRISDRAWPRYLRLRHFFRPLIALAGVIVAQSDRDRERFSQLGADAFALAEPCNLKYDAAIQAKPILLPRNQATPVWIAASTVGPDEGGSSARHQVIEESLVIEAYRQLVAKHPDLLVILAPRQPARFEQVARLLAEAEIPFQRRSTLLASAAPIAAGILLLDTIGELAGLYHLADVVFVGGSIAPRGGHNILEPAAAGKAIVVGPNMANFQSIADEFAAARAVWQIKEGESLVSAVAQLLDKPDEARAMGERAMKLLAARAGAAAQLASRAIGFSSINRFRGCRPVPARMLLSALAFAWTLGGRVKRSRAERFAATRQPLSKPVISVGGLTLGGSGKTPFTSFLAELLHREHGRPAILTRGYRRRLPARQVLALPGAAVPTTFTGDEAQLYIRTGFAAVGIAADRYQAGKNLLHYYPELDVFLLDDGFQHARLPRDLDIVLIDGLDPFGEFATVPAGRLREPLQALRRAGLVVVTRCQSEDQFRAICNEVRRYNASVPLLEAPLRVKGWYDAFNGRPVHVPTGTKLMAFCGLGNPRNFWATLTALGMHIVARESFPDHHLYKPSELRTLRYAAEQHGAELLVTTEKDMVNLPEEAVHALGEITVVCLSIELYVKEEGTLRELLTRVLRENPNQAVSSPASAHRPS